MKVLFNQLSTLEQKSGVGHYANQLRNHLLDVRGCQLTAFPFDRWLTWHRHLRRVWQGLRQLRTRIHWLNPLAVLGGFGRVGARLRQWYEKWLSRLHHQAFFGDQFDLYHEPNFIPFPTSLPVIATFHDLSALLHPEWHPSARVKWFEDQMPLTLRQTTHYVTVSEFTRDQVIQHLDIAPERITAIPNGPRPEFQPLPPERVAAVLARRNLPSQYLLHVGTLEPRKNLVRLMQAYGMLPRELRQKWPLLLVGGWGWKVERIRQHYEDVARHEGVLHVGYVADEDMPAILNGARALVFPSLYEGFGLPPLEMLACGGAVLASRIPPIVEVAAGVAHFVAPEDTEGWRDAMHKVLADDDWWRQLRHHALATARSFSWQRTAERTAEVYRTVLRQRRAA